MTHIHPKHLSCSEYSKQVKVVLQNTRIQTRGLNAGGGAVFSRYYIPVTATQAYFLFYLLLINQIYVPHRNVV